MTDLEYVLLTAQDAEFTVARTRDLFAVTRARAAWRADQFTVRVGVVTRRLLGEVTAPARRTRTLLVRDLPQLDERLDGVEFTE